ncbi:MAG: hypothetical protein QJR14_08470 [Bacillota bacterium]|nr:hypothetical protein [Bacillota bacterium]
MARSAGRAGLAFLLAAWIAAALPPLPRPDPRPLPAAALAAGPLFPREEAQVQGEQAQVQALLDQLAALDVRLARVEEASAAAGRELEAARRRLAEARNRAAVLEAERRSTAARTGAWLRWLRESGTPGMLDVFLGTASLRDLFWRLEILQRLSAYELGLLRKAAQLAEEARRARDRAEAEARRVVAARRALEAERQSLETLRRERARALAEARRRLAGAWSELEAREQAWRTGQQQLLAFWHALGRRSWAGARPSSTGIRFQPPELDLGFDAAALADLVGGDVRVGFAAPEMLLEIGPLRLHVKARALPGSGGAPDRLELDPVALDLDGRPVGPAVLAAWRPDPVRLLLPEVAPGLGLSTARVEPDRLLLVYAPRSGD